VSDGTNTRRGFLSFCTNCLLLILGLLVVAPAVAYVWAPLRRKRGDGGSGGDFVDLGSVADFPLGAWTLRALELVQEDGWKKTPIRHSVYVRRLGGGDPAFEVLSPICSHLGCPINWHPERKQFVCPCHGGIFADDGRFKSGPPPRSMDLLPFEVRAGRLRVRWQDFKIGVAERIPVTA